MNFSVDSNILETLLPIIIFVVWSLVGVFVQKKKKASQQLPQRKSESFSGQPSPSTSGKPTSPPTTGKDILTTIETIFQELSGTTAPEIEMEQHSVPSTPEPEAVQVESTLATKTIVKNNLPTSESSEIAKGFAPIKEDTTNVFADNYREHKEMIFDFSAEEARKGFIWSEILAPPVALRD
jgi:hypothetical protein